MTNETLERYFELILSRPHLFDNAMSDGLIIELDKNILSEYQATHHKKLGVVYASKYHILIVDLVHTGDKKYFTYERMITTEQGISTVMITTYQDKFVLLKQFRHALRDYQYAFARGFGTDNLSGQENAKKELHEEILGEVDNIQLLGTIAIDSGITDKLVEIYYCNVSSMQAQIGHENIEDCILLSFDQLYHWIKTGKINDSFTIMGFYLYCEKFQKILIN